MEQGLRFVSLDQGAHSSQVREDQQDHLRQYHIREKEFLLHTAHEQQELISYPNPGEEVNEYLQFMGCFLFAYRGEKYR